MLGSGRFAGVIGGKCVLIAVQFCGGQEHYVGQEDGGGDRFFYGLRTMKK